MKLKKGFMKKISIFLSFIYLPIIFVSFIATFAQADLLSSRTRQIDPSDPDFFIYNSRQILQKAQAETLAEENLTRPSKNKNFIAGQDQLFLPQSILDDIHLENSYISSAQFLLNGDPAHGAINNVYGNPTWVVPRENALAILSLKQAYDQTADVNFLYSAELAADYLLRIQDTDGAWFDQYNYATPAVLSKSPTQTAEVMIALDKLGYNTNRYDAMKKGAQYLMSLQKAENKGGCELGGGCDGLVGGGKKADGTYHSYRWASDNSFAYLALKSAQRWATQAIDTAFASEAGCSASKILSGINNKLYVSNVADPNYGVWHRVIQQNGTPVDPDYKEWINYAPQMLDLPATGVGNPLVGEWIHNNLQKTDGSVVWDNQTFSNRKSPGYSFQASLVWLDLGQTQYSDAATNWARNSGLWQTTPDLNGISGGWIDWIDDPTTAQFWERFIDTSFYATSVFSGGYDFSD